MDLAQFTQDASPLPRSEWQVPYDEHVVTDGIASLWRAAPNEAWIGDVRLAFFFHYLELNRGLLTPWGEVALPRESPHPGHLQAMSYEPP